MLVGVGLVFAFTACGFTAMIVNDINATGELELAGESEFIQFFKDHGFTALMIELVVLALATFGAMATDEMWVDRVDPATTKGKGHPPPPDE